MTDKLVEALEQVIASAQRDMARTNTDFLGRMGQTLCEYQDIFEEHPDGDLGGDVREEADEAILSLSGLALAQLFMLRGFNRSDVAALASRPEAGAVGTGDQAKSDGMDEAANFCIETLAKALDVDDWQIADGSETWDGDVAGTIYNVLKAGRVYDEEDGRVARLEDATPPRHPAGDALREDA